MNQIYVTVELIKNPAVKRNMTLVSAKSNSRKWRIVSDQLVSEPVKKKVVESAVKTIQPITTATTVSEANDDLGTAIKSNGFATIGEETDFDNQSNLRAEYESLTGKPADKRWKTERLEKEIETLKTPTV